MSDSNRVSVIISARNEYPQIAMTIDNFMLDFYQSGIEEWEIIIADNGSTDNTSLFFKYAWADPYAKGSRIQRPKELKYGPRGLVTEGKVRFVYDPIFSNVGARHKAVKYARYENIIFADAHISLKPLTTKYVIETLNKHQGVVHVPIAWMGASVQRPHAGIQYTYKIGEKIWGTWNFAQVSEDPFYIPVSGHAFIAVKKKQYEDFGGYDTHQRVYGGGENYLDTLYWLLGSTVMVDPRGLIFHLSAGRGYSYDTNSLIHNMILTAYTLGDFKWAERILLAYLNKPGTDKEFLKEIYDSAIEEGKEKRDLISSRQIMTIDELLKVDAIHDCDGSCRGKKFVGVSNHARRPWDIKNDELHGNHLSFVVVFNEWLSRLTEPEAIEFYKNSPHQNS